MVYLSIIYAKIKGKAPYFLATRNVHKSFLSAISLTNCKVDFINVKNNNGYLSNNLTPDILEKYLSNLKTLPTFLYVTTPDYYGNVLDIKAIKKVLEKYDVLLLVDCAHGSYLKFLNSSLFPIDLGANMCASSAHKTLPVLTGGAYLHLSNKVHLVLGNYVKEAFNLFGSSSPSYLTLASLDKFNEISQTKFKNSLLKNIKKLEILKAKLTKLGYEILNGEPLKLTVLTKSFGYTGVEFSKILYDNKIILELYDNDAVVLSFSANSKKADYDAVFRVFTNIVKKPNINNLQPIITINQKKLDVNKVIHLETEYVLVENSKNRIYAELNVHCPPAVPIIIPGEIISNEVIEAFKYYGVKTVKVIKE